MQPLVSVIIPTYSRPKNILRALNSVIAQTYQNVEIIVIDDNGIGTKEQEYTANILAPYMDKIVYLKHDKNKNGAAARNTGIKSAQGEYIAFLDDDDEWEKTKLQEQVSVANKHSGSVLTYCQSDVYLGNSEMLVEPKNGIKKEECISEYLFVNKGFIPTPSIFVSSDVAKNNLFEESLRRHQDYDFVFKVEQEVEEILFVDKPLVVIHWEDNTYANIKKKGHSPELSENFYISRKQCFTKKSGRSFILSNVVFSAVRSNRYMYAFKKFIQYQLLGLFIEKCMVKCKLKKV